jgi:hypothetical protein
MKKKLALALVVAAGAIAMLVPTASSAADPCVVVDGPAGLHLQLGYSPNGPDGCTHLP